MIPLAAFLPENWDVPDPADLPDTSAWPTEAEVVMERLAAPVTGTIPVVTAPTAHHAHVGAMTAAIEFARSILARFLDADGEHAELVSAYNALRAVTA